MKVPIRQFFRALPDKLQEEDKVKHILWSFWLTLIALFLWSAPLACAAVFFVGLAKECWDVRYGSGFCMFDMAGNFVGIFAGLALGLGFSTLL